MFWLHFRVKPYFFKQYEHKCTCNAQVWVCASRAFLKSSIWMQSGIPIHFHLTNINNCWNHANLAHKHACIFLTTSLQCSTLTRAIWRFLLMIHGSKSAKIFHNSIKHKLFDTGGNIKRELQCNFMYQCPNEDHCRVNDVTAEFRRLLVKYISV